MLLRRLLSRLSKKRLIKPGVIMSLVLMLFGTSVIAHEQGHGHDQPKSLYDRLGGLGPISVVVNDFIDATLQDDILNGNKTVKSATKQVATPYLKYHVTSLFCEVTGGPCKYTGRKMKQTHQRLRIKEKEWNQMIVLFKQVAAKHRVPGKETQELLNIIGSNKKAIVIPSM